MVSSLRILSFFNSRFAAVFLGLLRDPEGEFVAHSYNKENLHKLIRHHEKKGLFSGLVFDKNFQKFKLFFLLKSDVTKSQI